MARIKKKKTVTHVTLELSEPEATALARLLGHHVSGPDNGPRRLTGPIYRALHGAGIYGLPFIVKETVFTDRLHLLADD